MQNLFGNLVIQFREFYKNLSPMKRTSIMVASLIVVIAVGIVAMMASSRDYAPLLTHVPTNEVPAIAAKLRSKNIPFHISPDGTSILVPRSLVHSTEMAIMTEMGSDNLGTVGLEIFDKEDFGTTSFAQHVNYQRALQGELIRAIDTLDAVRQCKVILALPPKKTFLESSSPPTASVVVDLYPGKNLSDEQVNGIVYLVSNAVQGMTPDHVTVVDTNGNVLSHHSSGMASISGDLLEMKLKREQELEQRVKHILERVVGRGNVSVEVDATLNNANTATTEELVDPDKTAVLAQTATGETLNGARNNPTGIPGSRSNLPGAQTTGTVAFNQNVNKTSQTTNYVVPKTITNIKEGPGSIKRLSVAVLVNGITTTTRGANGQTVETWKPLSAAKIAQLTALVKDAVGFDPTRNDTVTVENMRFQKEDFSSANQMMTELQRTKMIRDLMRWAIMAFGLGLFFFLVIRPFMRWITDSFQDSVEDMLPRTIEELEELQAVDNTLPGMSGALPILEETLDPDKAESELLRDRIMNLMNSDEEKAASAFSLWLVRKDM